MNKVPFKSLDDASKHSKTKLSNFKDLEDHSFPREVQPQPEPLVFNGEVNRWYKTKRNGQIMSVFLIEVKKDEVIIKDREDDKHSRSMSLAKFIKFYA